MEKYAKLVKQQSSAHGPIHGHVYVPCRATDPDPGVVVGFGYAFLKSSDPDAVLVRRVSLILK